MVVHFFVGEHHLGTCCGILYGCRVCDWIFMVRVILRKSSPLMHTYNLLLVPNTAPNTIHTQSVKYQQFNITHSLQSHHITNTLSDYQTNQTSNTVPSNLNYLLFNQEPFPTFSISTIHQHTRTKICTISHSTQSHNHTSQQPTHPTTINNISSQHTTQLTAPTHYADKFLHTF